MNTYLNIESSLPAMRLHSVLEVGRTLTLTEKGSKDAEVIRAADGFRIVATMNPGGDYGKKELSPSLNNRFTQIWVPPIDKLEELLSIMQFNLAGKTRLAETIVCCWTDISLLLCYSICSSLDGNEDSF